MLPIAPSTYYEQKAREKDPSRQPARATDPPVANTDTKLLIYGLFQKGRVLAQDEVEFAFSDAQCSGDDQRTVFCDACRLYRPVCGT